MSWKGGSTYSRASMAGLALQVDVGVAAHVDRDPLDRAAGEPVRGLARIVVGHRLAAVAADAQALAREAEFPGWVLIRPSPTFWSPW